MLRERVSSSIYLAYEPEVFGTIHNQPERAQRHASQGEDHDHHCAVGITVLSLYRAESWLVDAILLMVGLGVTALIVRLKTVGQHCEQGHR